VGTFSRSTRLVILDKSSDAGEVGCTSSTTIDEDESDTASIVGSLGGRAVSEPRPGTSSDFSLTSDSGSVFEVDKTEPGRNAVSGASQRA
jgi:hypothetical protein